MAFPYQRMRRLRRTPVLRRLVAETRLSVDDLVAPLFVREGLSGKERVPIATLPGQYQHSIGSLVAEAQQLIELGIPALMLFGVVEQTRKDEIGSAAFDPDAIVQRAIKELRESYGDEIIIMADLCLDEYTEHGHCGVLGSANSLRYQRKMLRGSHMFDDARLDSEVDNDTTIELYKKIALAQADAGADVVAPSGMMDGQVRAIRSALDEASYFEKIILSYSAKYASTLYGPFRDAVEVSLGANNDRRSYQQDPANRRESLLEVELDISEGADIVMIKPAITCLDVIRDIRLASEVPLAAYQVSGEYAMIKAAGQAGLLDEEDAMLEQLIAIKRAGADFIVTYFASDAARILNRSCR